MAAKGGAIRMTQADVDAHQARIVAQATANIAAGAKTSPSAAPGKQTATQRMQALGRLPKGVQNKTEKRYDDYLTAQKHLGNIQWFRFEGIKLMLAANTSITIDFACMSREGFLEMHDVKAAKHLISDDFKAKCKVAASLFPFIFKVVYPIPDKDGGGWHTETVGQ